MSVENLTRLPLIGHVAHEEAARGYWKDLWIDADFSVDLTPVRPVSLIRISGFIPEDIEGEWNLTVKVDEREFRKQVHPGHVCLTLEPDPVLCGPFTLTLSGSAEDSRRIAERFGDSRRLLMVLKAITFGHPQAPRGRQATPVSEGGGAIKWKLPWRQKQAREQRVYLHIGMPKTGTSVIQHMLLRNTAALWDNGLCYPVEVLCGTADRWVAHHNLALSLLEGNHQCWDQMRQELARSPQLDAIISSEVFSNLRRPERIQYLCDKLKGYDVQIIAYVRRQDEFIESLYHNYIMYDSLTQTFDEFFGECIMNNREHGSFNYWHILETFWADFFGSGNISLRIYARDMFFNGNILHDFLHTLGVKNIAGYDFEVPSYTRSLSVFELELFRQIKMCFADDPAAVAKVRHHLLQGNSRVLHERKKLISPEQSKEIMESVSESNNLLADKYLSRGERRRFRETVGWSPMDGYVHESPRVGAADVTALLEAISSDLAEKFIRLEAVK